ncbi:MAG: proton-conducting transporter membrane subunit [Candidatus Brocadiia bacterium]
MTQSTLLTATILVPIICGILCFILRNRAIRTLLITVNALILIASSVWLLTGGEFTFSPEPYWNTIITVLDFALLTYFLYIGFASGNLAVIVLSLLQIVPLGYFEYTQGHNLEASPSFVVDQLAIIMCLVISIVGSLISLYAIRYMDEHEEHLHLAKSRQPVFFLFFILFLGAMNALVFANSLMWLYFFWEVTTLACYQLIRHDLNAEAKNNALRALWMNLIGGVGFVVAIIMIQSSMSTLSLTEVVHSPAGAAMLIPLALLCLAGFTKSAQLPFQNWLLGAMVAPTPVSALLHSSTMVNAGVYLLLRLAPAYKGSPLSTMVMLIGAFSFFVTAIIAMTQSNAKKLLAYSTIGNLGIIVMCAGLNTPLAITAALILLVFHAVSKGLLFMCAGVIENKIHSRDIEKMSELITRMPLTTVITVIGIITMFLAPFGLLVGKWATMEGAMQANTQWALIAVIMLVLGSAATTVFWTKYLGRLINQSSFDGKHPIEPLSFLYKLPLISLVLIAVIMSILVAPLYDTVIIPAVSAHYQAIVNTGSWNINIPQIGSFTTWPLFIVVIAALLMPLLLLRSRRQDIGPVYMCGENAPAGACEFCSIADSSEPLQTGGLYFSDTITEASMEKIFTPIGIIMILVLFGLLL